MSDEAPGLDDLRAIIVPAIKSYLDGVTRWACLAGQAEEVERRHDLGKHALESLLADILADLRKWGEGKKANELTKRLEAWLAARPRNVDIFLDGTLHEPDEVRRRHMANRIASELGLSVEETELLAVIIESGYQSNFRDPQPWPGAPDPDA